VWKAALATKTPHLLSNVDDNFESPKKLVAMNCPEQAPISGLSPQAGDVCYSVAFSLMLALTFTWALSAIGFLFDASIERWQAICGVLLAVFLLFRQHREARARWRSLSCLTVVLASCLIIAAFTVDPTFDGWAYHQPGVIALSHGWNPVTVPVFGTWWAPYGRSIGYPAGAPPVDILWTTVYPKALWILGAQAVAWGLPLDSGKYPGLILIFVAGLTALRALRLRGIPNSWAYPLSALAALNPVCVVQSTTFYVDGALGSCLAILVFSLLSYDVTRSSRDLLLALSAVVLACNLKFTGPVYTGLILLPFAVWWLSKRRPLARELLLCGGAALLLLAASVNPYLTNLKHFGSPVYPLNQWDVMEDQMSRGFLEAPSLKKLLLSLTFSNLASPPAGNPATDGSNFTGPLQSRGFEEFKNFGGTADLRIGGFGPFFGITIAVALLSAVLLIRGPKVRIGFAVAALGTLLSIAINQQMWWARLVPQMWLPPVLVAAAATASRSRSVKALATIIVLLMGGTSLIAVIGRTTSSYSLTRTYRENLKRIGDASLSVDASAGEIPFLATLIYRLHEQGATFDVAAGQCATPIDLLAIQGCKNDSGNR
jgi:hypothetical protein